MVRGRDGENGGKNGLMQIGELARKAGITLRTVRYYEELGLIRFALRTKGGFRLYDDAELRKLALIRDLQDLDFPLAKIRALFSRKRDARCGADLARDVRETLSDHMQAMDERIARYQAMRDAILESMDMVRACEVCALRPVPEVCWSCPAVTRRSEVPLPMRALLSVS